MVLTLRASVGGPDSIRHQVRRPLLQTTAAARLISAAAILILVALAVPDSSADTPPTQGWLQRYAGNGSGNNQVTVMKRDAAGNIIVTGYSSGVWWDIATVKYSPSGRLLHSARYNGPAGGDDVPYAMAIDSKGNVYIAGYTDGNGQANYDYLTVKYDSTLVQQWARTYAGQFNIGLDEAFAIATDHDDNVYVTGDSFEASTDHDFATIKYDPSGVEQWVRRYNGPGDQGDGANGIVTDDGGNVYVTGISNGSMTGFNPDCATVKYDTNGVLQWVRRYDGPGQANDSGIALAWDASGLYVAGYQTGSGTRFDFLTIKYTADGNQEWVRTHDGVSHGYDSGHALTLDRDSNVYVVGFETTSNGDSDYSTIKYDSAGNEKWVRTYDGPVHGFDEGQAIAVDSSENVYVTGYSDGGTQMVNYDYATVKYDPTGVEQWIVRYNGPGDNIDVCEGIVPDDQGHVFVSGWSTGLRGTYVDFTTIRYDQSSPAAVAIGGASPDVRLLGVTPNPFSSATSIGFALPSDMPVELSLFDATGRKVGGMRWDRLSAGDHSIPLLLAGLPAGTYLYRLRAGSVTRSGKMTRQE